MIKYEANYDFHTQQRRHMVRYGLKDPSITLGKVMGYSITGIGFLLLILI